MIAGTLGTRAGTNWGHWGQRDPFQLGTLGTNPFRRGVPVPGGKLSPGERSLSCFELDRVVEVGGAARPRCTGTALNRLLRRASAGKSASYAQLQRIANPPAALQSRQTLGGMR